MLRFLIVLIAFLGLTTPGHALLGGSGETWTPSFTAGGLDPNSVFVGGTEGRNFAVLRANTASATLFWGNGYWEDTPGGEGAQNAQVLSLATPEALGGQWTQDVNFGSFCPADNLVCALATADLQTLTWAWDAGGNAVTVSTLVASTWWEGTSALVGCASPNTPVNVYVKNNADLLWYQTQLTCDPGVGAGTPQVRSFGIHTDQVIVSPQTEQYAFAGEASTGIFSGQLAVTRSAGNNLITWNSNPEWKSSNYSGPPCTNQIRIMGFAEVTGTDGVTREYMTACFSVYVRVDGLQSSCNSDQVFINGTGLCQQRWQLAWSDPTPGTSESGLRGLTEVVSAGAQVLLTGAEGTSPIKLWRIPPIENTGSFSDCGFIVNGVVTPASIPATCGTSEANVNNFAGSASGGMTIGNTVAPYNRFSLAYDQTNTGRRLIGISSYITAPSSTVPPYSNYTFLRLGGTGSGKKWAEGLYLFRTSSGNYNLITMPQVFSTPMNGVRDIIPSPWPSECGYPPQATGVSNPYNCALYATGYDADGASEYYWCNPPPCPTSPPFVPTHNTAWIARYGY
jgi:hypothetical protein